MCCTSLQLIIITKEIWKNQCHLFLEILLNPPPHQAVTDLNFSIILWLTPKMSRVDSSKRKPQDLTITSSSL
ncbi:hypothetical protein FGO68_gene4137 [Halteria grandinella]|uniref:Uncharacterized protein n=1 Tax=Halteria grandinella TaxID=5974 RepID=A0A8J8NZB2_HALGN|nr:hypothetical protein FGO68_gene4137 [Halteria grandinella]